MLTYIQGHTESTQYMFTVSDRTVNLILTLFLKSWGRGAGEPGLEYALSLILNVLKILLWGEKNATLYFYLIRLKSSLAMSALSSGILRAKIPNLTKYKSISFKKQVRINKVLLSDTVPAIMLKPLMLPT